MGKKSSPSLKRKRSKSSSKAKAKSKSKSRKYKSKKVRRREVSLSSSDYDDSMSLDTSVSSSSEDSYIRKRGRSRPRKDVKGSKKKARRRSHSCGSSEDSLYARKRKKMKRKREYEVKEKPHRKKKIKRAASVSSTSSGSLSCSTCRSGSAGSDGGQYESRRGRSERKEKGKQRLERGRSGSEKSSRYRTRSCSTCSLSSESNYERTEEMYVGENNSRRLRSVITVVKEAEECAEFSRNETKEEIVDDYDYPCRSNDSNDGGTKRELDHHTLPATEEKFRDEDEIGDANADSAGTSEPTKNKTSEICGDNLNGDDLESILRQRALENLRKFQGRKPSTAKASDQKIEILSQVKQSITENHDVVQGKSNVNNAAVGTKFDNKTFVEETSFPVGRKNLIAYPRNSERLNIGKDISVSAKNHLACVPEKMIDADNPSEIVNESTNYRTNKPELTTPESRHDSLRRHLSLKQKPVSRLHQEKSVVAESGKDNGTSEASHIASHSSNDNVDNIRGLSSAVPKPSSHGHNNLNKGQDEVEEHPQFELKQTYASLKPPNAKLLVTEGDVERNEANTTQAAIQSTSNSGRDVDETTTKSGIENSSLENNLGKLPDESNQGSQFEQKTMTVMRGGEMVQVSYKVYIPKKAPALARRNLKR